MLISAGTRCNRFKISIIILISCLDSQLESGHIQTPEWTQKHQWTANAKLLTFSGDCDTWGVLLMKSLTGSSYYISKSPINHRIWFCKLECHGVNCTEFTTFYIDYLPFKFFYFEPLCPLVFKFYSLLYFGNSSLKLIFSTSYNLGLMPLGHYTQQAWEEMIVSLSGKIPWLLPRYTFPNDLLETNFSVTPGSYHLICQLTVQFGQWTEKKKRFNTKLMSVKLLLITRK